MGTATPVNQDPGHDMDLVTVFSSMNHDAEMEAMALHSLLEANGIDSVVAGSPTIPSVEFQVLVAKSQVGEAERIMAEAKAAGPEAAVEAEQEGEAAAGTTSP